MTHGRDARSPRDIPLRGWFDIGRRILTRQGNANLSLLAAGVAFYGLLSLFPGITALTAIAGQFISDDMLVGASESLSELLPEGAQSLVMGQLTDLAGADADLLNLTAMIALGVALFSASRAMQNIVVGLNVVFEEKERRGFILLTLANIGMTLALIGGLIAAVVVVAGLPLALQFLGAGAIISWIITPLRWIFLFALGIFGIAALYRFGPSRRSARLRWLTPGAVLACLLWVAGSMGFSFYVESFGSYNETFGTLAGVIVLLTWLWLSAFVLLIGALLDAEIEAQTHVDTTIGPERPMGERRAVKADESGVAAE